MLAPLKPMITAPKTAMVIAMNEIVTEMATGETGVGTATTIESDVIETEAAIE